MDAPDLDHGDDEKGPPEGGDGDHRPDPDWRLVGLLAFGFSFCALSAWQFGRQLVQVLK